MNKCYKVAVLIDGAFFLKRYWRLQPESSELSAKEVADQIHRFALQHVGKHNDLYRIYYYDCRPLEKKFHNPVSGKAIDFRKDPNSIFRLELFEELKKKRKTALRLGHLKDNGNWLIDTRHTKPLSVRHSQT